MSAVSPAMQAAMSRREASLPGKPRSLAYEGVTYHAHEPEHWLVVSDGLVYLRTKHVDVILNGVEFPRYDHDGAGRVTLTGNWKPVTCSLDFARRRFEHIEAWRLRVANYPLDVACVDKCMASLMAAIDAAEAWLRKAGRPPNLQGHHHDL